MGHCQTGTGQSAKKPEGASMKGLLKALHSLKFKYVRLWLMSDGNWAWCFARASLSELEDTGQISLKSRSSRCRFIKLDRQKLTRKRKGLTQKRTSYSSLAAHCLLWHPVQFVSVQVKQDMLNPTDCFRTNTHNQTSINTYPHTLPQNTMTHFQKNQHDWPHPVSVYQRFISRA